MFPIVSLALISLLSTGDAAGGDLIPVLKNVQMSGELIQFELEIRNDGESDKNGDLPIAFFALPSWDSYYAQRKGEVFGPFVSNVSVAAGESATVFISSILPLVEAAGTYVFGALINASHRLTESDYNNNFTRDLLPASLPENLVQLSRDGIDLHCDVRNAGPRFGGMSHSWRLFKKGHGDTRGLTSFFMIYNPQHHRLEPSSYAKSVGWVNMGQAYDKEGELLPYDVYHQSPSFEAAEPGELYLLTFVNEMWNVREWDYSNNISMAKFQASHLNTIEDEIWLVGTEDSISRPLRISTNYAKDFQWTVVSRMPRGLSLSQTEGALGQSSSTYVEPTLTATTTTPLQTYSLTLNAQNQDGVLEQKTLPIRVFKLDPQQSAELEVSTPAMTFEAVDAYFSEAQNLELRNTGSTDLHWRVMNSSSQELRFPGERAGVIPAGESANLVVLLDSQALAVGSHRLNLRIQTNTSEEVKAVTVNVTILAPK